MVVADASRDNEATTLMWDRLKIDIGPGYRALAARDMKGRLLGVIALNAWMACVCFVHIVILDKHALRPLLKAAKQLAFEDMGLRAVIGVHEDGSPANKLALGLGFKEVGRVTEGATFMRDLVFVELRPENLRLERRRAA